MRSKWFLYQPARLKSWPVFLHPCNGRGVSARTDKVDPPYHFAAIRTPTEGAWGDWLFHLKAASGWLLPLTLCLVSELGLAKYLSLGARKARLSESIATAHQSGMEVVVIEGRGLLRASMPVGEVADARVQVGPMLWLVVEEQHPERLARVLSPFELM